MYKSCYNLVWSKVVISTVGGRDMKKIKLIKPLFLTSAILSGVVAANAFYAPVTHAEGVVQSEMAPMAENNALADARQAAEQAKQELEAAVVAQKAAQAEVDAEKAKLDAGHTNVNTAQTEVENKLDAQVKDLGDQQVKLEEQKEQAVKEQVNATNELNAKKEALAEVEKGAQSDELKALQDKVDGLKEEKHL